MAGKKCADIVFCIDISGSMESAIHGVKRHINDLIRGLKNQGQDEWNVRFDFLAFSDNLNGIHWYYSYSTMKKGQKKDPIDALYHRKDKSYFFTEDIREFQDALNQLDVISSEQQLVALDTACDYPWRSSDECHRVIVLLSDDEVHDFGIPEQISKMPKLIQKIQNKRIKLFIIGPECDSYEELGSLNRCEYIDLGDLFTVNFGNTTFDQVDFGTMLNTIGKSVSVSQTYDGGLSETNPLFGQETWPANVHPSLDFL